MSKNNSKMQQQVINYFITVEAKPGSEFFWFRVIIYSLLRPL